MHVFALLFLVFQFSTFTKALSVLRRTIKLFMQGFYDAKWFIVLIISLQVIFSIIFYVLGA